jgi:hypothetical protein
MTEPGASDRPTVHVFGIRHHGPGSARSLAAALAALAPDAVLIEGPPDADDLLALAAGEAMRPPVALLVYRPESPREAVYYPFAAFSPEWQAIRFALGRGLPVRFMDLPVAHWLGAEAEAEAEPDPAAPPAAEGEAEGPPPEASPPPTRRWRHDPLGLLAEAAGFAEAERWWEHVVEHRRDGGDVFAAVLDAMAAVRSHLPPVDDPHELRREAHMRQAIRAARAAGANRIAVVCGAWHAPALLESAWPAAKADAALLKGLPRAKVAATWTPWTHGRLAAESGYGAGVESPGWYHHLWAVSDRVAQRWLTRVARLLRAEGLDASTASTIEAVRLAEALAALRGRHLPGLDELTEATRTVFCGGDETPLRLIRRKLIVGEALGAVPPETPMVPLVQDLQRQQKALRLPPDAAAATKELNLRTDTDRARSRLLYRLDVLGVPWGRLEGTRGKGTFKEVWALQWQPEFAVDLIEASHHGPTVAEAAESLLIERTEADPDLPALTELLDRALLADLPGAAARIRARLQDQAAVASDALQLLRALPPLARLARYSDVRDTDSDLVARVASGIALRASVGLSGACASLDDEAAAEMFAAIVGADAAIRLLPDANALDAWQAALRGLADREGLHGLIGGRATRLLLDNGVLDADDAARRMGLAVSTADAPGDAAAWVEGFLKDSGELLYYDDALFGVFDAWLAGLPADAFLPLLPLLRRTFATFEPPVRRNLGEKAARARTPAASRATAPPAGGPSVPFDPDLAARALPLVARLLGLVADPAERVPSVPSGDPGGTGVPPVSAAR